MNRYKTRLVAKGYAQTYDINYEETYSLVAKMTTIRAIIAMATIKGWSLHQMDVNKIKIMEIYKKKCTWNNHQVMWTKHILIWFVG
jgi:hypothetical protein